jgi:RNA polymerase sigma factor (sigma-70 family)
LFRPAGGMGELEAEMRLERARLVRLCARLTGDREAAEDLAQETLLVAWRNSHKLYGPELHSKWLAGIARKVCLSWARGRGRELRRLERTDGEPDAGPERLADEFDVEVELERDELVDLLDRALALLPDETRGVLIKRYVEESPHSEIAARLGISDKAVSMRLSRGKLLLRRVLITELGQEAISHGLISPDAAGWQETRIWCPSCGRRRLMGRFDRNDPDSRFRLRCRDCHPDPDFAHSNVHIGRGHFRELLEGVRTFKPALNRIGNWVSDCYTSGLREGSLPCANCGRRNLLRLHLSERVPPYVRSQSGLHVRCEACDEVVWENTLPGLLLSLPEAKRFQREHPRIRTLPEREIRFEGTPALVTTFESLSGSDRLDVICSRDTLEPLGLYRETVAAAG